MSYWSAERGQPTTSSRLVTLAADFIVRLRRIRMIPTALEVVSPKLLEESQIPSRRALTPLSLN